MNGAGVFLSGRFGVKPLDPATGGYLINYSLLSDTCKSMQVSGCANGTDLSAHSVAVLPCPRESPQGASQNAAAEAPIGHQRFRAIRLVWWDRVFTPDQGVILWRVPQQLGIQYD